MTVPRSEFDEKAATWDDDPAKTERARAVAAAVSAAVPLDRHMRLLEYGAGTGLVSQALRDSVGPVTLADSSRGMLDVMRAKIAAGTISDARVWDLDLSRDAVPEERFDLIVTVMALHHIPDLPPVLAGLGAMLEPEGRLCIADLEREDGSFHGPDFEGHSGFARDDLAVQLDVAGLAVIDFTHCCDVPRHGRSYGLFLATCARGSVAPRA